MSIRPQTWEGEKADGTRVKRGPMLSRAHGGGLASTFSSLEGDES